MEITPLGPFRMVEQGWGLADQGGFIFRGGTAVDSRVWHARRGFAKFQTKTLERLCEDMEVDAAAFPKNDCYHEAISLALVLRVFQELCGEEEVNEARAIEIMLAAKLAEEAPAEELMGELTAELIHDCFLVGEFSDASALVEESLKRQQTREVKRQRVHAVTQANFHKATAEVKKAKAKAQTKAAAAKAAKALLERQRKWVTELEAEPMNVVLRDRPDGSWIHVDHANGRFRIMYPGSGYKSFSWTLRGPADCTKCVLDWLWTEHEKSHPTDRRPAHLML